MSPVHGGARTSHHARGFALLSAGILISLLVGCSAFENTGTPKSQADGSPAVVAGSAKLDSSTQSITFPIDKYSMSVLEGHIIEYAALLLKKDCMQRQGLDLLLIKPFESFNDPSGGNYEGGATPNHIWGLWSVSAASKWGYEDPPSPLRDRMIAANGATLSPADAAVLDACSATVRDSKGLSVDKLLGDGTTITYRAQLHTYPENTTAGKKAYADWTSCLRKANLAPTPSDPFIPAGALAMSKEEQIEVALTDVKCKQSTGMIQQLADIEAAYQQVYVDKNQAALVVWREKIQTTVDRAKDVIHARE